MRRILTGLTILSFAVQSFGYAKYVSPVLSHIQSQPQTPVYAPSLVLGVEPVGNEGNFAKSRPSDLHESERLGFELLKNSWGSELASNIVLIPDPSIANPDLVKYLNTIASEKATLMSLYGVSNRTYNKLAAMAFAISGNESSYFRGTKFKLKENHPTLVVISKDVQSIASKLVKAAKGEQVDLKKLPSQPSRGGTQIKIFPPRVAEYYSQHSFGDFTTRGLSDPTVAAVATMGYLCQAIIDLSHVRTNTGINEENIFDFIKFYYEGPRVAVIQNKADPEQSHYVLKLKERMGSLVIMERQPPMLYRSDLGGFRAELYGTKLCYPPLKSANRRNLQIDTKATPVICGS